MKQVGGMLVMVALGLGLETSAMAQGRHDDKPHGMPAAAATPAQPIDGAIPLKDGGQLVVRKDGTSYHVDSGGKRVRMRDGVIMEGADGVKYMMKNDAIWKTITEKGTLHPSHQ